MSDTTMRKKRTLIVWEIPSLRENEYIEMYLNPENIQISSSKMISEQRTKGGFITQYWGENLDDINITGTTGDGGIEAINVLRDIYKNEQLTLINLLKLKDSGIKRRQSLMQLAASVVMWYQGQGYQGYFTNMSYTESVGKLGMFDYQMNFKVVAMYGRRRNFMPWHRAPWSTIERPSVKVGSRMYGGGYGTNYKLGELNTPAIGDMQQPQIIPDSGPGGANATKGVQAGILRRTPKKHTKHQNFDSRLNVGRIQIAGKINEEQGSLSQRLNDRLSKEQRRRENPGGYDDKDKYSPDDPAIKKTLRGSQSTTSKGRKGRNISTKKKSAINKVTGKVTDFF